MNATQELRFQTWMQASDTLHQHWHVAVDNENSKAFHENRSPALMPAPTLEQINELANGIMTYTDGPVKPTDSFPLPVVTNKQRM